MADTSVILGRDTGLLQPVIIDEEARQRGLYILGGTGTGKTTLILNLILQDLNEGLGMCVLDPHGDLIDDILLRLPASREQDVLLLDAGDSEHPFALNFFEHPPSNDPAAAPRTADQAVEIFKKVWGEISWGPQLEDLLRNIAYLLLDNPGYTLADVPAILRDADLRAHLVQNVTNPVAREFWAEEYAPMRPHDQREMARSTVNKVRSFLLNPSLRRIVGQSTSSVDFREAMDKGQVILVKLAMGKVGEHIVNLLGSLMVAQIFNAALSRQEIQIGERRQFSIFADEYFRFSTPYFAQLLTDARKFAIATTVAHQFRDQFEQFDLNRGATLGAANLVVFRSNAKDARELAGQFSTSSDATEFTTEIIPEPVITRWTEYKWEPPEAELEYNALGLELEQARLDLDVFCTAATTYNSPETGESRTTPDGVGVVNALLRGLQDGGERGEKALWQVYRLFNPWAQDAETARALDAIAYLPGEARLPRQHGPTQYLLPTTLGSAIEHYLVDLEHRLEPPQADLARSLLMEVRSLMSPLKARATYVFDASRPLNPGDRVISLFGRNTSPWRARPVPEMIDWFTDRFTQLRQRRDDLDARRDRLFNEARKQVVRSAYAGYDLPVKEVVGYTRWGDPIETQRYRTKPTLRTHSDVEAEVANEIVLLGDYRALCRIKAGSHIAEYRIQTVRPPAARQPKAAAKLLADIKRRSNMMYTRSRAEVDMEMEARVAVRDEAHATQRAVQLN